MEEIIFYKTPLFWAIIGLVVSLAIGGWLFSGRNGEDERFNRDDLNKQTTAPIVEDKISPADEEKIIKTLEAPVVSKDALTPEESARILEGTTAPIPGVK